MRTIKVVIFDMDGVIFDTENLYLETWKSVFKRYNYKMTKEVYTSVMGRGRKNVIKTFKEIYGDDLPIDRMYQEKDYELAKAIDENKVKIKEGVYELLDFLNENGYKTALATSAKRERAIKQLERANLLNKFNVIICGDEIENSKPNPEIFLLAANKLNIKNANCLVIEDSAAGLKAAFDAEMTVAHVPDLLEANEEMKKNFHMTFNNLLDIKKYFYNKL